MTDEPPSECTCGGPNRWADDPSFPVEFDPLVGEYQLVHGTDERWRTIMRFCPACVGRLPSIRQALFMMPSEAEKSDVRSLLSASKSADDALHALGKPDRTDDWPEDESRPLQHENELKWVRSFQYLRRWKTLDVTILRLPDGSFSYSVTGKYTGERSTLTSPDEPPPTKPWWRFWGK